MCWSTNLAPQKLPASEARAALRLPLRLLLLLLLLAAAIALAPPAGGSGKSTRFDCAGGVCGFNLAAGDMLEAPCKRQPVLVAYSESSGATLIQCGGADGTTSYLFDRGASGRAGLELSGTRFIKSDFLAEASENGVPDRFGPVPLCARPASAAAAAGEFVLLAKVPAPGADGSYCYRVIRAGAGDGHGHGALALRADSGEPPVGAQAHKKWRKLAAKVLRRIRSGDPH